MVVWELPLLHLKMEVTVSEPCDVIRVEITVSALNIGNERVFKHQVLQMKIV